MHVLCCVKAGSFGEASLFPRRKLKDYKLRMPVSQAQVLMASLKDILELGAWWGRMRRSHAQQLSPKCGTC